MYIWSVYSGFLMRAIVCSLGFIPCAVMQQIRFTSSASVTAISRSASLTPACSNVFMDAQFPCTPIMSYRSSVDSSTFKLASISVKSYPSAESCLVSIAPTFPSPAIIIFTSFCPPVLCNPCIILYHLSLKKQREQRKSFPPLAHIYSGLFISHLQFSLL